MTASFHTGNCSEGRSSGVRSCRVTLAWGPRSLRQTRRQARQRNERREKAFQAEETARASVRRPDQRAGPRGCSGAREERGALCLRVSEATGGSGGAILGVRRAKEALTRCGGCGGGRE